MVALTGLALLSCGSDSDKRLVCPASGIGVTASTGESCSAAIARDETSAASKDCLAQFSDYKKYDCVSPQIGLDSTKRRFVVQVDAEAPFTDINWVITNCAGGAAGKKLHIKSVTVAGDSECFFTQAPDLDSNEIAAGGQASMRLQFKPKAVGEYQAAVYIISDAQNFPKMIMPVCVKVVPKATTVDLGTTPDATRKDSGAKKDAAVKKDTSAAPIFDCVDVTSKCNDTCHPGCSSVIKT